MSSTIRNIYTDTILVCSVHLYNLSWSMSNLHWLSFLSLCQRTPLYVAAREGCGSIVKYLVSRKANINIRAKNGVSVTNYFSTTDLSCNPRKPNPVFMGPFSRDYGMCNFFYTDLPGSQSVSAINWKNRSIASLQTKYERKEINLPSKQSKYVY